MSKRQPYEVIVKENGIKRSVFVQEARSPGDAASRIKGAGRVISVQKVPIEKVLGTGEFLRFASIPKELYGVDVHNAR